MPARHPIPLHRPDVGAAERESVQRCLLEGPLGAGGPEGEALTRELSGITGSPHVLLAGSATQALELAWAALDLRAGDEVVLPSFTFPSTVNGLLARGATPVFADIDAETLTLDPADVARVAGARTRALVPVVYGGVGCDVPALRAAVGHDVLVVEDAAHGIGARRDELHVGRAADAAVLSFHETKNVACGEGGALLLADADVAARAEVLADKGTNRAAFLRGEVERYEWVGVGISGGLAEPLCALVRSQLARLGTLTDARLAVAARYDAAFADAFADGRLRPQAIPTACRSNGHLYTVRTRDRAARQRLADALAAAGVEAAIHFVPLHDTAFARERVGAPRELPVTRDVEATLLRLPIYPSLTEAEQARVIDAVREGVPD